VDANGRPFPVPHRSARRAVTLAGPESDPVAVIVHDPAVLDDPRLVEAVTGAAGLAAANARLQAEVQARAIEVEASRRRILDAEDEERRRLERRLHDGPERRVVEILRDLGRLRLSTSGAAQRGERIARAEDHLRETLEELHQLARGLAPRTLVEDGLERAVESLAGLCPVPVDITVSPDDRMVPRVRATAYFVCAEALANIAKHAAATKAAVSITVDHDRVTVTVVDDGVGGAEPTRGSGLRGLADRVAAVGGALSVTSVPGHGTTLVADIFNGGEGHSS
jgi:signal transduction histidine kinase